MFCNKCGQEISDKARFCKFCGAKSSAGKSGEPLPHTQLPDLQLNNPQEQFFTPAPADVSVSNIVLPDLQLNGPQEQVDTPAPADTPAPDIRLPDLQLNGPQEQPDVQIPATQTSPDSSLPYVLPQVQLTNTLPYDTVIPPKTPEKKSKKWWLLALIALLLVAAILLAILLPKNSSNNPENIKEEITTENGTQQPVVNPADATRTIMVYIVGSNLETEDGSATNDIQEMLDAELNDDKTQIIICAGGANEWENDTVSSGETSYYQVTEDEFAKVHQQTKKNMGISSTLSDFMNWSVSNHPADRYGLILWNHGGGPIFGYGEDELSGDWLTMEEMVEAFNNSPFNSRNKLEFLGFDACIMGSVETAWLFRDYAEYYIASQENEPGNGWNYEFLSSLSSCTNGGDIGRNIIDCYFDFYEEQFNSQPYTETEITLSCIDLSKIETVEAAIDNLFAGVNKDVLAGKIATASRCRKKSKSFGKTDEDYIYDLIDLKHIATLLSSTYDKASELEDAVDSAVVYSKSNISNANGLSIYHPYENTEDFSEFIDIYESFDFADTYSEYIVNFMDCLQDGEQYRSAYQGFSQTQGSATENGQNSDIEIQLTSEQAETFSSAKYYVFYEVEPSDSLSGETEYLQVFTGQDVNLSSDGKLTATYEGKAVFGKDNVTGEYSSHPLTMTQIYDGSQNEKYYFTCIFTNDKNASDDSTINVNWFMKIINGNPVLLNAYPMEEDSDNKFPERMQIDPNEYDYYRFAGLAYFVSKDSNENTVFESSGSYYGWQFLRDNGFTLELRPIEDKENYRAVFLIEDIYGNTYFSDFIPLG